MPEDRNEFNNPLYNNERQSTIEPHALFTEEEEEMEQKKIRGRTHKDRTMSESSITVEH